MKKISYFLAVLSVLTVFGVSSALASPIALKITSGSTTVIVSDNNVTITPSANKLDQNPNLGEVQWSGKVGDWVLNVDLGMGSDALGLEHMDLTYNVTSAKSTPSGPLTIWLTEINVPRTTTFDATIGGTNNRTSTQYSTYYSAGDGFFATTSLIASSGLFSSPTTSKTFGYEGSGTNILRHPFSLTEKITIAAAAGALPGGRTRIASGDAALDGTPVPEPSTLLLMAGGLAGFAVIARRRFTAAQK